MSSTNNTTPTSSSSRPSFSRSKTMPAFRRALSLPSVDKSLASLRASSSKGLRRMSSFRKQSTSPSLASPSTESIPVFTIPDYAKPTASPPSVTVSPLTRPSLKRALTMPNPVRAMRSIAKMPALKRVCERKESVASDCSESTASVRTSIASTSTSTSTRRRRSSSVSSVESFSSTEDRVTLALRMRALPSTIRGLLTSILAVLLILLLPAMAAEKPKSKPAPRPYERDIVLTEEQERNPPRLPPPSTLSSRISRRMAKAYRRTLRRASRAQRANTPHEALAALFAPTPKRVRAKTPVPVDPKTLAADIPLVVYSSPISLPLSKGPAPAVRPSRKARKFTILPTVKEESLDDALCAGW
ncbi:hypothetical protein B0H13DRAFT_2666698 [Mycena leptocephala]|nr:hypothetical protein B0H13DRAFT_2666698 [Mycena leptocephala]